jgi:activator of 2-hydroxyglutaryl-CoA dehydratase
MTLRVFSELDALSALNHGASPQEVGAAVVEAVAVRANTTFNDITAQQRDCVVLIGGMTRNAAFVSALKALSGIDFCIPEEAEYASAIGAALSAI